MKRCSWLMPPALLAVILAFCLCDSAAMTGHTDRWRAQLAQAEALAQAEDFSGAAALLADSYRDWSRHQTYLHIVTEHDAVEVAESMYLRAAAFAHTQELSEFRAETAGLLLLGRSYIEKGAASTARLVHKNRIQKIKFIS